jgi:glycosyltransferase involved in cell wall biosynthesis
MESRRVILVSNDIVPGCGLPVAAPGLRVFGLANGLVARGFQPTTVIVRGPLDRQWRAPVPPALPRDAVALNAHHLGEYLQSHAPAVVVLTNANQVDRLIENDGNRYILDFFAPKLLERVYEGGADGPYPVEDLKVLRERKLRGIELADGFIVNGRKKVPYFLAWILQTDRDLRTLPIEHVGMCLPAFFTDRAVPADDEPVRFAMAGYLQGWSIPGPWLRALPPHLAAGRATLDAMMPEHWGGASGFANPELTGLVSSHAITVHHAKTFDGFRRFLSDCDVVLDLFEWTRERELAVVTRTVSALCCGKPVVHPPFTEVSPLIEKYDAGWVVEPSDEAAVTETFATIVADRSTIERKARGARALWQAELDPAVVVNGLVKVIEQITRAEALSA